MPAVTPDPENPGFFNVEGVAGYFPKETAERVARQVGGEDHKEPQKEKSAEPTEEKAARGKKSAEK